MEVQMGQVLVSALRRSLGAAVSPALVVVVDLWSGF